MISALLRRWKTLWFEVRTIALPRLGLELAVVTDFHDISVLRHDE